MKLPTFRRDAAAGLAIAQAKLAAVEAKIAELEQERQTALAESDDLASVHTLDKAITEQRQAAVTYADRVRLLKAAMRQQQAEQFEQQRQAALAVVAKRLEQQVELAKQVEQAVRDLGDRWSELLNWQQSITGGWPAELPLPKPSDFEDVRQLRRELATALYGAGRPAWDRLCNIPAPVSPIGVQGLESKGISGYVAAAGAGFIERIKSEKLPTDEEAAA
jgi:hypothetical protein